MSVISSKCYLILICLPDYSDIECSIWSVAICINFSFYLFISVNFVFSHQGVHFLVTDLKSCLNIKGISPCALLNMLQHIWVG